MNTLTLPEMIILRKIEELRDNMGYGVMSTPGVVIDGKVVFTPGAYR